jgi:SprT protein
MRFVQESRKPHLVSMDKRHIKEWVWFACECNEVPELAQTIIVEWNARFTRRLGDAMYNPYTFRARVRLSLPLWPRASERDRRETVIHEVSHVIVKYLYGPFVADHGAEWKEAMRNCGIEPLRTHSVDRTGLVRRQRRFILLDCPNQGMQHKCRMNVKEYNLLQRGTEMWCKKCALHLTPDLAVEEDGLRNYDATASGMLR